LARRADSDTVAISRVLSLMLGSNTPVTFERTEAGTSTEVFAVYRDSDTFYLRLAESAESDLAAEAMVHTRLHDLGVRVPAVVDYRQDVAGLGRSAMLTTGIPGGPVTSSGDAATIRRVYRQAGHDLATINSVTVDGFSWIDRSKPACWPLRGEVSTYPDFVAAGALVASLDAVPGFTTLERETIAAMIRTEAQAAPADGWGRLAHGDLDIVHVFGDHGVYSGIIDFGEIRGADPIYDLAVFSLVVDDPSTALAFDQLQAGYAEATSLPDNVSDRLATCAAFIAATRLSRWFGRAPTTAPSTPHFQLITRRLISLARHRRAGTF